MIVDQVPVTFPEEVAILARSEQIILAITTVFFYDWISTLSLEIAEIWGAKWSYMKCLYLCTRYLNWAYWILSTLQLFIFPTQSTPFSSEISTICSKLNLISSIIAIVARLASMGLFTLRIWAIYELNFRILISLGFLSLSLFVVNLLALFGFIPFVRIDREVGLSYLLLVDEGLLFGGYCNFGRNRLTTTWCPSVIWGSLIFDAVVFFLTLQKTRRNYRVSKEAGLNNSFYGYLLRDGSLYYLAVAILDLVYVIISFNGYLDDISLATLSSLTSILETILSCRLVLNLKRLRYSSPGRSANRFSVTDLQFATNGFLGNIGAPLRSADEDGMDFDEDIEPFGRDDESAVIQDMQCGPQNGEDSESLSLST